VEPVPPEDVKPSIAPPDRSDIEIQEEPFADLIVNMSELELSLSSSVGELKVLLLAHQAEKNETGYAIEDGKLQFAIEERSTLELRVQDATLTTSDGITATDTLELSGYLVGHVTGSDQYFEATRLTCDLNGVKTDSEDVVYYVYTDKVVYRAPSIDVSGERMILELPSGIVKFEGRVEASI